MRQLLKNGKNNIIHGGEENEQFGYISREMNHIDTIDTLKYDVRGRNVDIVTLITIEDENGNVEGVSDITFNEKTKEFIVTKSLGESFNIKLCSRNRINADKVEVEKINNDTFKFSNLNRDEGITYAWYVIDKETATPLIRTEYNSNADFSYTFKEEGDYLIKAYVKSGNGRYRCSRLVAEITYNAEKTTYQLGNTDDLNLVYLGHEYRKIQDNIYGFKINIKYAWNYNVAWYIYKDGGYYTNFSEENRPDMEYEFTESGKYTVMYYLRTPNGDNEFWNFKQIEIE